MKGFQIPDLLFWVIVAIIVSALFFLFANQIIVGYMKVKVIQP